jgi:hypothetical protein
MSLTNGRRLCGGDSVCHVWPGECAVVGGCSGQRHGFLVPGLVGL